MTFGRAGFQTSQRTAETFKYRCQKQQRRILAGEYLGKQTRKLVSRFKADEQVMRVLQTVEALPDLDHISKLVAGLLREQDVVRFERNLDTFVSSVRAVRAILQQPKGPTQSSDFIRAILKLARLYQRPPFKREIADELCAERSEIARLCREHGFTWFAQCAVWEAEEKLLRTESV